MSTPLFHGDRPAGVADKDAFGFAHLADRIADALTHQAAGKGFVMGVEGRWGSGKTSLLGRVVAKLKEGDPAKIAVVEFRPWLIGDRDQLLDALFIELAKAVGGLEKASGDATRETTSAVKDVAIKLQEFAGYLSPIGKLVGLIPGGSIPGNVIQALGEAAVERRNAPPLAQQKDDLAAALAKLDCRIVVTIDDVDRLVPVEVAEVLRLVRSVADFPNISYLLCYDGSALARAIEQTALIENGSAYLEKIVQTEFSIPRPESFRLRRWFADELKAFAPCPADREDDLRFMIGQP